MKFKSKPEALRALPDLPDPADVARFAAGAGTRTVEPAALPEMTVVPSVPPWEKLDKDAKPLSGLNLRLNAYEHELLKFLAESDDRSIQQTIKRLLIPAAESAAAAIRGDSSS
ncbi:MAG: hypothetical protein HOO96_17715 [Polyangiaceae bacterium]|nr:hypothetical protein [Polyangiaceae bacterium]